MRKITFMAALAVIALAGCGTSNNKYITDESIMQFKLASVSVFTQAQAQVEVTGADFRIGKLPEGDVAVCNMPVPRGMVKMLGKDLALDVKLAVCLAHGRNLPVVPDKDDQFLAEVEGMGLSYDMTCLVNDMACVSALKLTEGKWRQELPFRKGVPTETIDKTDKDIARKNLTRIGKDFGDSVERIKNNLRQSGGDLEIIYGIDSAFKDIYEYFEAYAAQPDGPVMPYADFDGVIKQYLATEYEKIFGQQLDLNQ
ncbi:MAG: hypothetical protein HGA95_03895 [Caldiserica bacterium]|nr:hypothetical protein [Caldisericota bacterium]